MIQKSSVDITKIQRRKIALVLLNDLLIDDFNLIANNLEFKKDILIITNTKLDTKKYQMQCMLDSLDDIQNLLRKLRLYKSTHNVDFVGIIGADEEYGYMFSEAIATEFKLKFHSKKTLDLVSDKYLQISALKAGGVDVPDFKLVDSYAECQGFKLPCVIKPVRGISSIHVYKCGDDKDLKNTFVKLDEYKSKATLLSLTHSSGSESKPVVQRSKGANSGKHFVLEEFIDGNEYSCDFLVGNFVGKDVQQDNTGVSNVSNVIVLRVVKKIVSKNYFPFFEGLYLFNPDSPDSEFSLSAIQTVCENIAKSLDIQTGVCMVDFRFDAKKKKIVVIETTTRLGIDDFIDLMYNDYGYISISLALRQIFGTLDVVSVRNIPRKSSMIVYLFAPREGKLKKLDVSKLEKLKLKGVREILKYYEIGDEVEYTGILKNPPFVGYVIIEDIASKDIDNIISKIRSNVDIELN